MSSLVHVAVHASQFPEQVRHDLLESLRTRQVNHKFHYDSIKQAQRWLAVHEAYSPARKDPDCASVYERSFAGIANIVNATKVNVIGLGCGGGQKDTRLLQMLRGAGKEVFYTPVDVSVALVLQATRSAGTVIPTEHCSPLVCDLAAASDLAEAFPQLRIGLAEAASLRAVLRSDHKRAQCLVARPRTFSHSGSSAEPLKVITFFGMLPNFEPALILPRLANLVRSQDYLLLSANLAPAANYLAGLQRIMPQYDNAPTREWLFTFLFDLSIEPQDGQLRFIIEDDPGKMTGLKRIAAHFHFRRRCEIQIETHRFRFQRGESMRLFFSYRHTPGLVKQLLAQQGLQVWQQWITAAEEEGVFLCRRAGGATTKWVK